MIVLLAMTVLARHAGRGFHFAYQCQQIVFAVAERSKVAVEQVARPCLNFALRGNPQLGYYGHVKPGGFLTHTECAS